MAPSVNDIILAEIRELRTRYNADIPKMRTDIEVMKVQLEGKSAIKHIVISTLPKVLTAVVAIAAFIRSL